MRLASHGYYSESNHISVWSRENKIISQHGVLSSEQRPSLSAFCAVAFHGGCPGCESYSGRWSSRHTWGHYEHPPRAPDHLRSFRWLCFPCCWVSSLAVICMPDVRSFASLELVISMQLSAFISTLNCVSSGAVCCAPPDRGHACRLFFHSIPFSSIHAQQTEGDLPYSWPAIEDI